MGVILYALLCGTLPFDDESIPNLFKKIKSGRVQSSFNFIFFSYLLGYVIDFKIFRNIDYLNAKIVFTILQRSYDRIYQYNIYVPSLPTACCYMIFKNSST